MRRAPRFFSQSGGGRRLHVLVVDDSAVVRQIMHAILSREKDIEVEAASDPYIAMNKMQRRRPDVIVLDLEMPRMDGLTFLQKIMSEDPIPVIVCSGLTGDGTEAALRAAEAGAVEIVTKPKLGVGQFIHESSMRFVDAVRAASQAKPRRRAPPAAIPRADSRRGGSLERPRRGTGLTFTTDKVVVVGASTGGTEAVRELLAAMPLDAPGLVIAQHMPEAFTRAFAKRLNESCQIEVKEAEHGDRVNQGRALIAPGDRHTLLARSGAHYEVEVTQGACVSRHRPSIDLLFRSAARAAGPNAVGVILTGMGDDGADGMLEMKLAGAHTIAQDEASCVVFGMPREAIARGGVRRIVNLSQLPEVILKECLGAETSGFATRK